MTNITIDEARLAQIMRDAANVLRNDGWATGDLYVAGEGYCAFGACWKALGVDYAEDAAHDIDWKSVEDENYLVSAINEYYIQNRDKFLPADYDGASMWSLAEFNDYIIQSADEMIAWFENEANNIEQAVPVS